MDDRTFKDGDEGKPLAPERVAGTLEDIVRTAEAIGARWVVIGGQALIAVERAKARGRS